jgi:phosphohistidine phosphatase
VRVTLIRHAEAGDDAPRDESRALTARGRADARRLGRVLARRGVRFSAIVTSPLVRAVQTAEIVAAATEYRGRMTATDLLVPEAAAADVAGMLARLAQDRVAAKSVALVAHEPILSAVAAALTHKSRYPALRKSEALRIRLPDGPGAPGALRWRIDGGTGKRERLR